MERIGIRDIGSREGNLKIKSFAPLIDETIREIPTANTRFPPFGRKIKRGESSRSTRCISLAVAISRITASESKKERKEEKRERERVEVGVKSVKLRKVVKHEVAGI